MKPNLANRAEDAWRQLCRLGVASCAAFALTSLTPSSAFAQASDDDDEETIDEVIVTGSRLQANPNLAAATPVLSVSGDEGIIRGNVRVEDFINVLPQVFAGQASEVSNGASGTATLNLRGLGSVRTLVLIDGRRLPYGSSSIASANVDLVPIQMVEKVDILTGGASAVYGSDAIGGVANFQLKRNFEGLEIGGQFGTSYADNDDPFFESILQAGGQPVSDSGFDGDETLIYAMMGINAPNGRGNATLYMAYEDREEILQADRVFSGCALGQDSGPQSFGGFGCVGSANFRLFGNNNFAFQQENGDINGFQGGPAETFNFGQFNFFQRPSERYNLYAKSYYEINESVEAFADFSYVNNVSDAQIAPSASFGFGAYNINCDNPLIAGNSGDLDLATDVFGCTDAQVAAGDIVTGITASHRNVEGGNRNSRLENSAFRVITGLRGDIADVWNWEAFMQIGETRDTSIASEDFIIANFQQSILVTEDADGNPVCTDPSGGCVPYNIFQRGPNGESLVTQEALDFISGPGVTQGSTSQFIYGGSIQADLGEYGIQLPTAEDGVGALFGVEFRRDELDARPDVISQQPDGGFTGVGGPTLPVAGEIEVFEFFSEIQVPLLTDAPLAQELTLNAQYRFSDYTADGNGVTNDFDANAYGFALAWVPMDDLRVRAQFQRAVRAPNVIELFTGQGTGLPNLTSAGTNANGVQLFDPCASSAPIATLAACQNTGVTAAQFGSIFDVISGQTQSLTGGNPQLDPESADTVTFGFVYTPEYLPNLSISVDYFNILVEDAISGGIAAQTVLDECLATGNEAFCSLINRGAGGTLAGGAAGVGFQATNINIAELETTGVDLQVIYDWDFGEHGLRVDYAGTVLDKLDTVPGPGLDVIPCAGFFGNQCGSPSPEYRHRIVGTWTTPWSVDITTTWRHFGATDVDTPTEVVETELHATNYIDVSANWYVTDDLVLRGSVLNLFDQDPPIFSSAGPALGNGNTYPTVFDTSTVFVAALQYNF